MTEEPYYHRALLKISGEGLMGEKNAIDPSVLNRLALEIKAVHDCGVQLCLVVGGGNIFRGVAGASNGMNRATADYIGMLATVMNAMALQEALEKNGVDTRIQSALPIDAVAEPYIRRKALHHLSENRIVIFAAGTGKPYFTTDTCAILRATEMECDVCLKSTQVDGIYDTDPKSNKNAQRYDTVSYDEVLNKKLKVMDITAVSMAAQVELPVIVFNQGRPGAFKDAIFGKGVYTIMSNRKS